MKATELMIGDWIAKYLTENKTIKSGVVAIDGDYPFIRTTLGGIFHPETFDPIPLTEEILEKNGWVDADYSTTDSPDNHFFPEDTEHKLELMVGCGRTILWTINTGEYIIMEIKYVHQLQHALRLCGIEKEIKL